MTRLLPNRSPGAHPPTRALRGTDEHGRVRAHLFRMEQSVVLPIFLTQREVADLLRLPERTLEDWRQTRQGPPYEKLGCHIRYEQAELLTWVRERRHG